VYYTAYAVLCDTVLSRNEFIIIRFVRTMSSHQDLVWKNL